MVDPWKRIAQSPATSAIAAGGKLSAAFSQSTPLDSTHTLVAIAQWSGAASDATNSWSTSAESGSGSNGSGNYVSYYILQGDGVKNSIEFTFTVAQTQAAVTLLAFEGYVEADPHTYGFTNPAASTTSTSGPPTAPTTANNTIGIVVTGLSSGGGGTWGTWNNGFTSVPLSQSRLHIGAIAYTTANQSPQASITHSSSRAQRNLAFTIRGNAPANNALPTVNVGPDIKKLVGDGATVVKATASDTDGTIASYTWAIVSTDIGVTPGFSGQGTDTIIIGAPTRPYTVTVRCTVEDDKGGSSFDEMILRVSIDRGLPTDKDHAWRNRYRGKERRADIYIGQSYDLGLIAEWDFSQSSGNFFSKDNALPLVRMGTVNRVTSPWGYAADLTGSPNYLSISQDNCGALNLGDWANTAGVTVAAWVRREDTDTGFIAGGWQEDSNNPRRQYGLFIDLGMYGGSQQSCFHVSKTGGPTPGYPYSRDYSASGQTVTNEVWELHVGTYDGTQIKSYLNGQFTNVPTYTDNQNQTYAKNPYVFTEGLNATPVEFTVGAVRLTNGMGNWFDGQIAKLRVWNRALRANEIARIYSVEKPA